MSKNKRVNHCPNPLSRFFDIGFLKAHLLWIVWMGWYLLFYLFLFQPRMNLVFLVLESWFGQLVGIDVNPWRVILEIYVNP
jgi:hypothetical protein